MDFLKDCRCRRGQDCYEQSDDDGAVYFGDVLIAVALYGGMSGVDEPDECPGGKRHLSYFIEEALSSGEGSKGECLDGQHF
jgi:hypothetical protein